MEDEEQLEVIARFTDPGEAQLARGFLEASDIPSFLSDQHIISIAWTYSNALGGVKLSVPKDYAVEARELLQSLGEQEVEEDEPSCPACGSTSVSGTRAERKWGALALLTGVVVPIVGKRLQCGDCGHYWKQREPYTPLPDIPAAESREDLPGGEMKIGIQGAYWLLWLVMLTIALWMGAIYR